MLANSIYKQMHFNRSLSNSHSNRSKIFFTSSPVMNGALEIRPFSSGHAPLRLSPPPYQWPWSSPEEEGSTGKQSVGLTPSFRDCQNKLWRRKDNAVITSFVFQTRAW